MGKDDTSAEQQDAEYRERVEAQTKKADEGKDDDSK